MANTGHAARVDAKTGMGSGKQFVLDIFNWAKKANASMDKVVRGTAFEMGSRIISRTPVDTGRAKANWMCAEGAPDASVSDETSSGASVARLSHVLVGHDPRTARSIFFTNALPYIRPLEYGWSGQAPHGMVRVTLVEFGRIIKEQVRIVRAKGPSLP